MISRLEPNDEVANQFYYRNKKPILVKSDGLSQRFKMNDIDVAIEVFLKSTGDYSSVEGYIYGEADHGHLKIF